MARNIAYRFVVWWMGGVPIFIGQESDSVVPSVAASHDILKVFFEGEIGVESDS